jgi:hypothetical protein
LAKNKDDTKEEQNQNNSVKSIIDNFRATSKLTTAGVYGTDEQFHDDNSRDLADIRNTVNLITQQYKQNTGEKI